MKKNNLLIIIFLSLFALILLFYKLNYLNSIDNYIYNLIFNLKSDNMTVFMKSITFFASVEFFILLLIVLIISSFKNKKNLILGIVMVIESILNFFVKILVRRNRPFLINLVKENSFSFPSGHTMFAVVLYGFIIYKILKSKLNNTFKILIIFLLILIILLIMISRIYLGVHYFSDVLAGLSLALSYLFLVINVLERKKLL